MTWQAAETVRIDQKNGSMANNLDLGCLGIMQLEVRPRRALGVLQFLMCSAPLREMYSRPLKSGQPFQVTHLHQPGT